MKSKLPLIQKPNPHNDLPLSESKHLVQMTQDATNKNCSTRIITYNRFVYGNQNFHLPSGGKKNQKAKTKDYTCYQIPNNVEICRASIIEHITVMLLTFLLCILP